MIEWFKQDGQVVAKDDVLFELETDKITMQVEAEASGRLRVAVAAGSTVEIGQVVASIDTEDAAEIPEEIKAAAADSGAAVCGTPASQADVPAPSSRRPEQDLPTEPVHEPSPAVRRLIAEHEVDVSGLAGSGKDGRLTKGDVLAQIQRRDSSPAEVLPIAVRWADDGAGFGPAAADGAARDTQADEYAAAACGRASRAGSADGRDPDNL